MAKDTFLILSDFRPGWYKRDDDSRIPLGGARISSNITVTDRKGISPRPGELLLGTSNPTSSGGKSLTSFRKSEGADILIKNFSTKVEFYSNKGEDWSLVMDGFTDGLRFGYEEARIDATDVIDWIYFGNRVDPMQRWCGYDALIDGNITGGATSVTVDTTLLEEVYYTGTASATTTTTLTIASALWAADSWNDFYVRITSGASAGKISLISATTSTQITFAAIAGLAGTPTFEIRQLAIPATGTLVYGGNKIAYTGIPTDGSFTVGSAAAASDGDILTVAPEILVNNPKGNIFATILESLVVSGDPAKPITVFRSQTANAADFTFASPRAANEGDVVYFPYSGKYITDIKRFEGNLVVLKEDSIEDLNWSQTTNATGDVTDIAVQNSLKVGQKVGSVGRAWNTEDDIMFVTPDNRITSLGRVLNKDVRPQSEDLAYEIRREVKPYVFDEVAGTEHINEIFVCAKSDTTIAANNKMLVWNKDYTSWESVWTIQAADITPHNGKLYYIDSFSPDVYQMLVGTNKIRGTETFPLTSRWVSGWINKQGSSFYLNEVSCLAIEGRIRLNSTIEIKLYKDYAFTSFQDLQLTVTENIIDGQTVHSFLGGTPGGLEPLGTTSILGDEEDDGYRHFVAFLDFDQTQVEYISVEVGSSGLNQGWEIIRLGLNTTDTVFEAMNRINN